VKFPRQVRTRLGTRGAGAHRALDSRPEAERAHLARELHDDLSQQLAAVSIATSNLKKKIPLGADEAVVQSSRIQQKLVHMAECIPSAFAPVASLGVTAFRGSRRHYATTARNTARLTSHRIIFRCDTFRASVPQAVELCVYRVMQEALQNARKALPRERGGGRPGSMVSGAWRLDGIGPRRGYRPRGSAKATDSGWSASRSGRDCVNGTVEVRSRHDHGRCSR